MRGGGDEVVSEVFLHKRLSVGNQVLVILQIITLDISQDELHRKSTL